MSEQQASIIVETQMIVKDLKFKTLVSGDKQAQVLLELAYDDRNAIRQLKELADKEIVKVTIHE